MKILIEDNDVNRIVFHYNKKHNEDTSIPTWVIKHKGNTYYVNHLDSKVGFSTKETPDNDHTKGALQFKGKLQIVEEENGTTTANIT
jgi:hypothetical protein